MANSKNVHVVKHSFNIAQPAGGDSDAYIDLGSDAYIDLAVLLSEKYGRNIRQGQNFRLVGYGVHAQPESDADSDMGFAGRVDVSFQEPNAHYVKSWRQLFNIWKSQKRLMGRVGRFLRYDDFELAYDADGVVPGRTSVIYDDPLTSADGDSHFLTLTGASSEGGDITSLVTYYNERFPAYAASETQYGSVIKEAKFDTARPISATATSLRCPWAVSGSMTFPAVTGTTVVTNPYYFGGTSTGVTEWLPADNHLNVMNGLVKLSAKAWPPDTVAQAAEGMTISVTLALEGWSPLAKSSGRKSKK